MKDAGITPGSGLILYVCKSDMENTYARVMTMDYPIGADLALNPNSRQQEFALRDLDGYFLIFSEFRTN